GRNGNCERGMGELLVGSVQHSKTGQITRAGEQKAARVLYCAAHALEDCEIKVPNTTAPGQFPIVTKACQVVEVKRLSAYISQVLLQLPAGKKIEWYPGQYLMLLIDGQEYAFSIANAPVERQVELHIRHGVENVSAQKIMGYLHENSTVRVKLPMGTRHLGALNDQQRPLWLICGSTGFAQAKAMVAGAIEQKREIHLFWGARQAEELYLHELAQEWASKGVLTYTAVLSDEYVEGFAEGLVHEAVLATPVPAEQPQCLIAGSPAMAWAVFDALTAAGGDPQLLHSDVFDYAPRG